MKSSNPCQSIARLFQANKPMKKILLAILSVLGAAGLTRAQAQILNVNFIDDSISLDYGGSPVLPAPSAMSGAAAIGSAGDIWNGLGGFTYNPYPDNATFTSGPLVYANGSNSAITVTLSAPSGTYDANSSGFGNHSPFSWASLADETGDIGYPNTPYAKLMASCLVANSTSASGFVTLSNLTPNGVYNLYTYNASDQNETNGRTSTFTVNGVTLTSTYNGVTTNLVSGIDYLEFAGVAANGSGTLTINFGDLINSESDFNGFQLEAVTGPPGTFAPTNVTATLGYGTNANAVLVSFYQNDTTATGYNIWRSTNAESGYVEIATNVPVTFEAFYTGTNDVMLVDSNAVAGVEEYFYTVQSINPSGTSASSAAAGVLFGLGNQLVDAGFEVAQIATGDGAVGNNIVEGWDNVIGDNDDTYGFVVGGGTYCNGCNGTDTCGNVGAADAVLIHSGAQEAKLWTDVAPGFPDGNAAGIGFYHQTVAVPGGTWAAGGWAYDSHQDLLSGVSFDFEVDFVDSGGNLLAAYESYLVTNLTCTETSPYAVDTWNYLAVTNVMQVINGTNTGVVLTNIGPSGIMVAPHSTAAVTFQATAVGNSGTQSGSTFFDDCVLTELVAPTLTLPSISGISPNGILFSTNTALTFAVNSADSVITNVQAVVTTTPLGGASSTVTNKPGSPGWTITGLGTASANVSLSLSANLLYQVTITGTDGNGLFADASTTFDTLTPTLVIEGADFNYGGGQFIDTPANGGLGLYYGQNGDQGIDENWVRNAASPANDSYRGSDNVTIEPAAPNNGEELKFADISTNLLATDPWDVPQEIGYAIAGGWLNYTRDYGSAPTNSAPAGLYNVYADLANGGAGASVVDLYQVTGDITSSDQVSNLIGSFTANNTGGWNTYAYIPLQNAYGTNVAEVYLSGKATLRLQATGTTPNIGFIFLVPATVGQAPTGVATYPNGALPYEPTDAFSFTLDAGFAANGTAATLSGSEVGITLNGVNVTSSATFTNAAGGLSGSVPLTYQNQYTAVVTATNSAGLVSVSTVTFLNLDPSDYAVEFTDYDFSTNTGSGWVSGLFIDNAAPSGDSYNELAPPDNYDGEIATNSYFYYPKGFVPGGVANGVSGTPIVDPLGIGAIARQGVDINYPENGQTAAGAIYYRVDLNTSVGNNNDVGIQPSGDVTDGYRPKYSNARAFFNDTNIGSFNLGYCPTGGWLNYTRTFPTNNFYLWARFANGSGGDFVNTLSMVTSGVGTSNQTLQTLGTFSGAPTGGWTTYAWFPLRDANGNIANLSLGGKTTLRLTLTAPNDNPLFVQFAPAPPQFTLTPTIAAGQLNISFPTALGHTYKVLYTASLSPASWIQVGSTITGDGSVQVATESLSGPHGFYTVVME
jgi:hypothetical protein